MRLFSKKVDKVEYEYIFDGDMQELFEELHRRYEYHHEAESMHDYLMGVAATIPNPAYIQKIAISVRLFNNYPHGLKRVEKKLEGKK
jgi:hypothetical protein